MSLKEKVLSCCQSYGCLFGDFYMEDDVKDAVSKLKWILAEDELAIEQIDKIFGEFGK